MSLRDWAVLLIIGGTGLAAAVCAFIIVIRDIRYNKASAKGKETISIKNKEV